MDLPNIDITDKKIQYNNSIKQISDFIEKYKIFDDLCSSILSIDVNPDFYDNKNELIVNINIRYYIKDDSVHIRTSQDEVKMYHQSTHTIFRNNGIITSYLKIFDKPCLSLTNDFINLYYSMKNDNFIHTDVSNDSEDSKYLYQ
jgi:hypothetical protein